MNAPVQTQLRHRLQGIAKRAVACLAVVLFATSTVAPAQATSRIKDIATFEGVRENQLSDTAWSWA